MDGKAIDLIEQARRKQRAQEAGAHHVGRAAQQRGSAAQSGMGRGRDADIGARRVDPGGEGHGARAVDLVAQFDGHQAGAELLAQRVEIGGIGLAAFFGGDPQAAIVERVGRDLGEDQAAPGGAGIGEVAGRRGVEIVAALDGLARRPGQRIAQQGALAWLARSLAVPDQFWLKWVCAPSTSGSPPAVAGASAANGAAVVGAAWAVVVRVTAASAGLALWVEGALWADRIAVAASAGAAMVTALIRAE
jgi:hypothetical protein